LEAFSKSYDAQKHVCIFLETLIKASCMNLTMHQYAISEEQLADILGGLSKVEIPEKPEEVEHLLKETQLKFPTVIDSFTYIFTRECYVYEPNTFAFVDSIALLEKELTSNFQTLSFGAEQLCHVLEQFTLQMVDPTRCEPRHGDAKEVELLHQVLLGFHEIVAIELKENMDSFVEAVQEDNKMASLSVSCVKFCDCLSRRRPDLLPACVVLREGLGLLYQRVFTCLLEL
jgi:hypothetical protein